MKLFKRTFSLLLALVTICSMLAIPAMAASTTAFDILSSSKYAKTYMLSSSGSTIPYTSKSLSTRGTTSYGASSRAYIDNKADEIYILDVGCTNGQYWAYVSYPTSSRRVNAYIHLSAITANNASHAKTTSTGKFYCSLRSNSANSSKYYVATGDVVYLVATSGSKYQILYPISKGLYRLAWCDASDYNRYCGNSGGNTGNTTASTGWQWPMESFRVSQKFNRYAGTRSGRPYHCGIDIVSSNTNIYAAADGTVVYKGYSNGNGYHVVLSHNVNGTTVKTLYSHLSSYSACPAVGQHVSKGQKIGVMGNTGASTGPHLHFAIYTGSSNDPWGYTSSGGANKISYKGCVFYNPSYVIENGRLP